MVTHKFATLFQMPTIKSLPPHLRPREKLLARGPANLTDRELLAILLRTGRAGQSALDIAGNILAKHKINQKFPPYRLLYAPDHDNRVIIIIRIRYRQDSYKIRKFRRRHHQSQNFV